MEWALLAKIESILDDLLFICTVLMWLYKNPSTVTEG